MNSETMNEILRDLSKPFHPARITWRPGALTENKEKALALAYADLRAYQDRLDDICGLDWSVSYTPWGERIICHVTISGITRSSTGEADSDAERSEIAGTAAEAQAFKRACAMFGLGRYLYNLPTLWVEYDAEHARFTDKAKARLNGVIAQHYQRFLDGQQAEAEVTADELDDHGEVAEPTVALAPEEPHAAANGGVANGTTPHSPHGNGRVRRPKGGKGEEPTPTATTADTSDSVTPPTAPPPAAPREPVVKASADVAPLHQKLDQLGQELYGNQWEQVRAHNVKRLTGTQESANGMLTVEQIQKLIGGLEKLKQQRQLA